MMVVPNFIALKYYNKTRWDRVSFSHLEKVDIAAFLSKIFFDNVLHYNPLTLPMIISRTINMYNI